MLTGKHCDDIQDIIDAAKTIHANGVEIVAVSLWRRGILCGVVKKGFIRRRFRKSMQSIPWDAGIP